MAVTITANIVDRNGMTVFNRASLAENSTGTIWADKYDELSTTKVEGALLKTPMVGPVTLKITPSTRTEGTITTYVYYEENGKVSSYASSHVFTKATADSSKSLPIGGYFIGLGYVSGNIPSASPSLSPSISPSKSPSISPSKSPSISPSRSPSISPSKSPSISPSKSPSISPSKSPSLSPSE